MREKQVGRIEKIQIWVETKEILRIFKSAKKITPSCFLSFHGRFQALCTNFGAKNTNSGAPDTKMVFHKPKSNLQFHNVIV